MYIFVADLISALFYFVLPKLGFWALVAGLFVTSGLLFSLLLVPASYATGVLSLRKYFVLGAVQGLSMLPGISRFAATYVAGRWLSLSPRRAFQASFFIQIPLIAAAFFRAAIKLFWIPQRFLFCSWKALSVVIIAMAISYVLFLFTYRLAVNGKFWVFGLYTSLLAMVLMLRGII